MLPIDQSLAKAKPRYEILDGLRGVAALIVVAYHMCEILGSGDHTAQVLNHGYLAVDFFFALAIFNAWAALKLYDLPVRKWLTTRFKKG